MDTLLVEKDHYTAGCGAPLEIDGLDALMQQVLIRLAVRRGSFLPDPGLGSRLCQLPRGEQQALQAQALPMVQEALADLPGLQVERVDCRYHRGEDRLALTVGLRRQGTNYALEVTL